ncbi:hypothetical protein MRX96_033352 [Rhipicephalus microplus]
MRSLINSARLRADKWPLREGVDDESRRRGAMPITEQRKEQRQQASRGGVYAADDTYDELGSEYDAPFLYKRHPLSLARAVQHMRDSANPAHPWLYAGSRGWRIMRRSGRSAALLVSKPEPAQPCCEKRSCGRNGGMHK